MCGRFALFASPDLLAEYFELPAPVAQEARYNVTPGQAVAAVRLDRHAARRLVPLQWGLVPHWAKDPTIGRRLINARLETLVSRPAFREGFERRRCVVAASGFYEWARLAGDRKQPYFVAPRDEPLLALAGIWARWRGSDGEPLDTCAIITRQADTALARIHDRMPVMVGHADLTAWLDPRTPSAAVMEVTGRSALLEAWPVGTAVNDPRNDDPRLLDEAPASD